MILETIRDIRREDLIVPGGWRATVWEVEPEEAAFHAYMDLLTTSLQQTPDEAMQTVYRIVQDRFTMGFVHGLRMSIIGYAQRYVERYPHLRVWDEGRQAFVPRGFKPEVAQAFYLPSVGGGKVSGVDEELARMAEEAR